MKELTNKQVEFLKYVLENDLALTNDENRMVKRILRDGYYWPVDIKVLNDIRWIFKDVYAMHMKEITLY